MVNKWCNFIQPVLFPPTCLVCDGPGEDNRDLCQDCLTRLPQPGNPCLRCAQPLTGTTGPAVCGHCQTHPPAFDASHALFAYQPPIDRMVLNLKHHRQLAHARLLGDLLAGAAADWPRPDILVPIPLHPRRLWLRGFNQSLEIARFVSRRLAIPLDPGQCRRVRQTASQSDLNARERRRNLHGAFAVQGDWGGRRVAIIDDVMTTGSTAGALASELKAHGAAAVQVWVCARAGLNG